MVRTWYKREDRPFCREYTSFSEFIRQPADLHARTIDWFFPVLIIIQGRVVVSLKNNLLLLRSGLGPNSIPGFPRLDASFAFDPGLFWVATGTVRERLQFRDL
jgi:hypothetical protein